MRVLLCNESISNGVTSKGLAFVVEDGVIRRADEADAIKDEVRGAEVIDLRRYTVLPGLIDIHVHGGNGFDTMDGTYEAINGMSLYKIKEGVTSFVPATVTASEAMTDAAAACVDQAMQKGTDGARVLGLFLEGPYINPKNKGAHPLESIRAINAAEMKALADKAKGADTVCGKRVVSFAVAPELPGAAEAIKALSDEGVNVRVGHSSATISEADAGVSAGANIAIHTYNAMSPLNHREPGLVGAVMTNDGLYGEIICDLVHVHPRAVETLVRAKGPDKVILITDCMRAGGLPDGEYYLGELPVKVVNGIARLSDDALAGSTATLISCLKNMHETVGVPLADAVTMATATPARAVGVFDKVGSLEAGKRADIIAVDEYLTVRFVMVDGVVKLSNL